MRGGEILKTYMKPTLEIIELRPEERLATCGSHYVNSTWYIAIISAILGWCTRCKKVWSSSSQCS